MSCIVTKVFLLSETWKKVKAWDFPGCPVAKTPCSQFRGPGFHPWPGNWDPLCHNQGLGLPNRQVLPGVQNKAGQRLIEFCQENILVIANTLFRQHKRRLYTWTSPDGQYWNQTDYILSSWRWRSSIQSAKTRPGADCGSDHELLIAKFRLKLKKVGKTTRPFSYDLNKIPYDYIVEVTKKSKV